MDSARAEFMKQLPPEIRKEIEMGVPDTLVGRSAFAFKKFGPLHCAASPWIRRAGHQELVLPDLEPTEAAAAHHGGVPGPP